MHEHGYRTVYLLPEYGAGRPKEVDLRLESGASLSEFDKTVLEMTPIEPIMQRLGLGYTAAELHRRHLLFTLDRCGRCRAWACRRSSFTPICSARTRPSSGARTARKSTPIRRSPSARPGCGAPSRRRLYADQVTYLSKRVEETVAAIIAESRVPPVIIVCSDHGTEFEVDWSSAENSNMQERMADLAAFYFPRGGERLLYPTITNVNFFRSCSTASSGRATGCCRTAVLLDRRQALPIHRCRWTPWERRLVVKS